LVCFDNQNFKIVCMFIKTCFLVLHQANMCIKNIYFFSIKTSLKYIYIYICDFLRESDVLNVLKFEAIRDPYIKHVHTIQMATQNGLLNLKRNSSTIVCV